jgi:Xaa-Pro dipeptidase
MRERSEKIFATFGEDIDAIVLMNATMPITDSTFHYVSGVSRGGYENCAAVLRKGKRPLLVVSALEEESAGTAPDCDVEAYKTPDEQKDILRRTLGKPKRLGINANALVKAKADDLVEMFPGVELVNIAQAIQTCRLVKGPDEIEKIRRACAVTSDVALEIPKMLRKGVTEVELAAQIDHAMKLRGGSTAFDTIVCFGVNGSEPHYSPGDVPLEKGDLVLIDFGAKINSYCADITRMYCYGKANAKQRAMFDVVRKAQEYGLSLTRAGNAGRDVHLKVRDHIDATEFAGRFIHGTGHSVGLDVHDGPGIGESSEITLQPGMVMTVEPGVYVPEIGGVRIEDTVVVTEGAPEILTLATKDLVEVEA